MCRDLSLASAECDDRSRGPLRAAVARIGTEQAESRVRLIERLRSLLAQRARAKSTPSHTDVALGAALLLDPRNRSDAAETALFKLGAADADVQSFALSILVAFGRTPVAMHPAPRGALLALLLGAPEDSELARSELAAFVLSAASLQDSEPPPAPPAPAPPLAIPASPRMAQTPTPSGITTPRPAPPVAAAPPAPPVRMGLVIAIAAVSASLVLAIGVALRSRTPAQASTATAPAAMAPSPPEPEAPPASIATVEPAPPAPVAAPSAPPPASAAPRTEPRNSGPSSAAPKPTRRSEPGAQKLPGSGL